MAAIEIEKYIKELSEQELRDETIVKVILQYCFDDKKDMSAMAKGNSLDKIPLISKVYCLYNGVKTLALRRNL